MLKLKRMKTRCHATLEGEMTIYNAMALKEALLPLLDEPRELAIKLTGVTEIDSAGVQLLMMMKRERAARDLPMTLSDHSREVLDAFELMDLVGFFNDPIVLSGEKGERHGN